jgi:hypothetical protein
MGPLQQAHGGQGGESAGLMKLEFATSLMNLLAAALTLGGMIFPLIGWSVGEKKAPLRNNISKLAHNFLSRTLRAQPSPAMNERAENG